MSQVELEFEHGAASGTTLRSALAEIQEELNAEGVDLKDLGVRETAQGVEPTVASIVIFFVSHAGAKAFDDLIWPRLKGKLGVDSLGKRKRDNPPPQ